MKKLLIAILLFTGSFGVYAIGPTYLSSPSSGITLGSFQGFLSVRSVTGATGYQIQYDTTNSFNSGRMQTNYLPR